MISQEAARDVMRAYVSALDMFNRGEWQHAQRLVENVLVHAPRHGGAHFIAGTAAVQQNQLELGLRHLQQAAQFSPEKAEYLAQYARALAMSDDAAEATKVADAAMGLACADAATYDTLGVVFSRASAHGKAAEAFRRAVELAPEHANHRFNLATSHMYHGDLAKAEEEYEACARIDPRHWRAHFALSQLRRQTPESNHVARVEELLRSSRHDPGARLYLNLSLAKEFEDLGDYSRAFDHYTEGKSAHRGRTGYSSQRDAAVFDDIRRGFERLGSGIVPDQSREPFFVMGMPRSGTTLVDRILSSHGAVHSAGELDNFGLALKRANPGPAHSVAAAIADVAVFPGGFQPGRTYVESTRPNTGHTPYFVDKLPHNFLYAGFIAQALPNAKIICLRRNPMDTCLSNFRQLFALESPNHDYSYDILDTGRYYVLFDQLMKYWQQAVPGRIVELDYERLVEDQEGATRALLDACELPWEDACLRFEDNPGPVATASTVQVRSGMNTSSMQRWKRYETRLGGLKRVLAAGGIQID